MRRKLLRSPFSFLGRRGSGQKHVIAAALVMLAVIFTVALAAKNCPRCGTQNLDNARFCKNCGYEFPRQVSPALPALTVEVSTAPGQVKIVSEPAGASVFIDGKAAGVTPFVSGELTPGKHELVVKLGGYRDYRSSFVVPAATGAIRVRTVPSGVEVLLDGAFRATSTDTGVIISSVASGSHQLLFRLRGYKEETRTVELRAGELLVLEPVTLLPLPGFLAVTSEPERARVYVDGRLLGETRYLGQLAPARYELRLSKRGFQDWLSFVQVQGGETTTVVVTLEQLRTRKPVFLIAGLTGLTAGGAAAILGEVNYARYRRAETGEEAEKYRLATQRWDLVRNILAGLGALGFGAYILF